jgi:hypothetical protein
MEIKHISTLTYRRRRRKKKKKKKKKIFNKT